MCTCASCSYTDGFKDKGFAAWPRGEPAGPRRSAADYAAHVHYGKQWGRGYSGVMHEPKECTASMAYYCGSRAAPERLAIPKARWEQVGYHRSQRKWIEAPETMHEYIEQFEKLNGLKKQEPIKAPARPHAPGKAREHFREPDRRPVASARIYEMSAAKAKRKRGRPSIGITKRILVSLDKASVERARKLGGDNVSAGIRKALARRQSG